MRTAQSALATILVLGHQLLDSHIVAGSRLHQQVGNVVGSGLGEGTSVTHVRHLPGCVASAPNTFSSACDYFPNTRLWAAGAQRSAGTTRALYTT